MTMTNAIVLIESERDALSTLGGALADTTGVAEAYSVTGEWDFVAIVRVPDHEQLADVVTSRHRAAPRGRQNTDDGRLRGLLAARPRVDVLARGVRALRSISLKPGYGPSLPELLAPRWRRASPLVRGLCLALVILLVALAAVLALMLRNRTYSHGGSVPFSFSYRDMERKTAPERGGYVRLVHYVDGPLEDSFAVGPVRIGPYRGKLQLQLMLFANAYIRRLERSVPGSLRPADALAAGPLPGPLRDDDRRQAHVRS